ncbi:hypothetical protein OG777_03775 [Micromonospora peucetia]|uniref:Uncharacterized protein n=1 Tax=Micromonospora peucetia TaxID=47871 RepID=A0A1C6U4J1_9ACTN|nr:hypothetical protein [Micromonospora peucetia]MCX4386045.1 hypothetical protein [Micromonospora peucetia]WSA33409.1 hypothetical protein OIE14_04940 [Micromonospora peucetia]SCL48831.1 hypothetical protein GA0070608_0439 [Micromonospora peucetia]
MTTGAPTPAGRPPAHEHRARVELPEWMREPTPPRLTIGRRVSELVERLPALREARLSLWRWRDRTRWSESHPRITAVVSFFVVAAVATVLVTGALYLFHLIMLGEV